MYTFKKSEKIMQMNKVEADWIYHFGVMTVFSKTI